MSQGNETFKAAEISKRFKDACTAFDELLASRSSNDFVRYRQKLRDEVKEYRQQGALTVAFVGQYSAGKSTIISALTGRRDIHIDADIATDQVTDYDWNNIKIIDTPGLFTDRQDHDDITYEAIAKADLLVFCLTHMLFDTLTVENFKKLAYDQGYRWKMMLVINKMSAAAGDEAQKIASYRHSLAAALKPHGLSEFPICFIDAKDYCEGIDDDDEFLADISRFNSFIAALNQFVQQRAHLASFDTPIRIVLSCMDEAQIAFARNSDEDTTFLEVLSRLSRRINKNRERLRTKIRSINLKMSAAITAEGTKLASAVGDTNFKQRNQQAEENVRKQYEKAGQELEAAIEEAIQSIQSEVEAEMQSDLTQAFIAQLNCDRKIQVETTQKGGNSQQIKQQVASLVQIAEKAGVKITASATRNIMGTAQTSERFLRSMDVAGSSLHQGVLQAGKAIGFKFKPWQAVGIAKNIGNAAKFLGPALAVVSIGLEAHTMYQEQQQEAEMAAVRNDITSQFQAIAVDLEQQLDTQLYGFESQVYGQIEKKVAEARQQTETAMSSSNAGLNQLVSIRQQLESILQEILPGTMQPVL